MSKTETNGSEYNAATNGEAGERGKYWHAELFERMSVEEYEAVQSGTIDGSELIAWYVERGQTDSYLGRTTLGGDF
ncbi:hypothetical protein [Halogeometricum luteum]|uniref:Uncharacterized protein n=1 Tax=Halogeometricum luteum TaxID=2950537 RepID=A0ABU2G8H5_9EURY|nr:hypothetical protein [Halogeometricum sp. S3BR5-2]MDS0297117.1 hypothetical protein [Halogeometricum sp. S3BR5-2]